MNIKHLKLIRKYARLIGIHEKTVIDVFSKGDAFQKARDLVTMRATLYAQRRFTEEKKEWNLGDQQIYMEEFIKTVPNFEQLKWPDPPKKPAKKLKSPKKSAL